MQFDRISHDPGVIGGKPCIRGLRVTAGMILGLLATGESRERILKCYPYREAGGLGEAFPYTAYTRSYAGEEPLVVA